MKIKGDANKGKYRKRAMNYDASYMEDRARAKGKVVAKNVQNVLPVFFSSPHASYIGTSKAST